MRKNLYMILVVLCTAFAHAQSEVDVDQRKFDLNTAVAYALKYSPTIKMAELNQDITEETIWQTISIGLPQISGNGAYTFNIKQPVSLIPSEIFGGDPGTFQEVTFGTKQSLSAGVQLNQLLFDGSYIVGVQSTKVYRQIAALAKEQTELELTAGVIDAYAGVLITLETKKIMLDNKKVVEKNLSDIKAIYNEGFVEYQNVEQIEMSMATLETQLAVLRGQEKIAINMLKYVMGVPVTEDIELTDDIENLLKARETQTLLSYNFQPEEHIYYKVKDNTVMSNKLQVKYQKSKFLPTLSSFVNFNYSAYNNKFVFFDTKYFPSSIWGINLNVPIFSGLGKRSQVRQAEYKLTQAEVDRYQTEQKLLMDVKNAREQYISTLTALDLARHSEELAQSIYNKEKVKYFEGMSSSIDLSNTEGQLYNSQNNYIQSLYNVIEAKVSLLKAMDQF